MDKDMDGKESHTDRKGQGQSPSDPPMNKEVALPSWAVRPPREIQQCEEEEENESCSEPFEGEPSIPQNLNYPNPLHGMSEGSLPNSNHSLASLPGDAPRQSQPYYYPSIPQQPWLANQDPLRHGSAFVSPPRPPHTAAFQETYQYGRPPYSTYQGQGHGQPLNESQFTDTTQRGNNYQQKIGISQNGNYPPLSSNYSYNGNPVPYTNMPQFSSAVPHNVSSGLPLYRSPTSAQCIDSYTCRAPYVYNSPPQTMHLEYQSPQSNSGPYGSHRPQNLPLREEPYNSHYQSPQQQQQFDLQRQQQMSLQHANVMNQQRGQPEFQQHYPLQVQHQQYQQHPQQHQQQQQQQQLFHPQYYSPSQNYSQPQISQPYESSFTPYRQSYPNWQGYNNPTQGPMSYQSPYPSVPSGPQANYSTSSDYSTSKNLPHEACDTSSGYSCEQTSSNLSSPTSSTKSSKSQSKENCSAGDLSQRCTDTIDSGSSASAIESVNVRNDCRNSSSVQSGHNSKEPSIALSKLSDKNLDKSQPCRTPENTKTSDANNTAEKPLEDRNRSKSVRSLEHTGHGVDETGFEGTPAPATSFVVDWSDEKDRAAVSRAQQSFMRRSFRGKPFTSEDRTKSVENTSLSSSSTPIRVGSMRCSSARIGGVSDSLKSPARGRRSLNTSASGLPASSQSKNDTAHKPSTSGLSASQSKHHPAHKSNSLQTTNKSDKSDTRKPPLKHSTPHDLKSQGDEPPQSLIRAPTFEVIPQSGSELQKYEILDISADNIDIMDYNKMLVRKSSAIGPQQSRNNQSEIEAKSFSKNSFRYKSISPTRINRDSSTRSSLRAARNTTGLTQSFSNGNENIETESLISESNPIKTSLLESLKKLRKWKKESFRKLDLPSSSASASEDTDDVKDDVSDVSDAETYTLADQRAREADRGKILRDFDVAADDGGGEDGRKRVMELFIDERRLESDRQSTGGSTVESGSTRQSSDNRSDSIDDDVVLHDDEKAEESEIKGSADLTNTADAERKTNYLPIAGTSKRVLPAAPVESMATSNPQPTALSAYKSIRLATSKGSRPFSEDNSNIQNNSEIMKETSFGSFKKEPARTFLRKSSTSDCGEKNENFTRIREDWEIKCTGESGNASTYTTSTNTPNALHKYRSIFGDRLGQSRPSLSDDSKLTGRENVESFSETKIDKNDLIETTTKVHRQILESSKINSLHGGMITKTFSYSRDSKLKLGQQDSLKSPQSPGDNQGKSSGTYRSGRASAPLTEYLGKKSVFEVDVFDNLACSHKETSKQVKDGVNKCDTDDSPGRSRPPLGNESARKVNNSKSVPRDYARMTFSARQRSTSRSRLDKLINGSSFDKESTNDRRDSIDSKNTDQAKSGQRRSSSAEGRKGGSLRSMPKTPPPMPQNTRDELKSSFDYTEASPAVEIFPSGSMEENEGDLKYENGDDAINNNNTAQLDQNETNVKLTEELNNGNSILLNDNKEFLTDGSAFSVTKMNQMSTISSIHQMSARVKQLSSVLYQKLRSMQDGGCSLLSPTDLLPEVNDAAQSLDDSVKLDEVLKNLKESVRRLQCATNLCTTKP